MGVFLEGGRMKKALLIVMMSILTSSWACAEVLTWNSLILSGANGPGELTGTEVQFDGQGWWVEVWDYTSEAQVYHSDAPTSFGWQDVGGTESYYIQEYSFDVEELHNVVMRLYASTDENPSTPYSMIESQLYALPSLDRPLATGDTDVTFDFSGQEWQVVPEPGTMALFGLGLMTLAAKKMRKRKMA
jgi:hypothetical protein